MSTAGESSTVPQDTPEGSTVASGGSVQSGVSIPITDFTFNLTEAQINKAIESVTDKEITDFANLIDTTTQDDINPADFIALEYQGFDPLMVRLTLIAISKKHKEQLSQLKSDVMWMIAINIYMGNVQAKSHSRRSLRGRTIVGALVKKYGIKTGSQGAGQVSTMITFPRVSAAFPTLSTRMANKLPVKRYVRAPFHSFTLPGFMTIASFASLIDDEATEDLKMFLLEVVCAYSCDQSIVVAEGKSRAARQGKRPEPLGAIEAHSLQWPYIEAASNSPVPSGVMRRTLFTEYQLIDMYEIFQPVVTTLRNLIGQPAVVMDEEKYKKDIAAYIASAPKPDKIR